MDDPLAPETAAARRLAAALDAIEAALDQHLRGGDPGALARALAGPVASFDAAARAALRNPGDAP